MSSANRLLTGRRRLPFLVSLILLLAIFFVGFYYYYVPSNREQLDKYAFSILQNITTNIQQGDKNNIFLYKDYISQNNFDTTKIRRDLKGRGLAGRIFTDTARAGNDSVNQLAGISGNQFIYSFQNHGKKMFLSLSAEKLISPLLETHRKEIFESFLVLKIRDQMAYPVYSDNNFDIGQEIITDSLLASQKKILLPGIHDIEMRDLQYKMFFIPFSLENEQLVICGFVRSNTYSSQVHQIPVKFIYPIIVAILLLLIALPLIKFYIMGPRENLRLSDLFGFLTSIFIGSSVLTMIIIQVLLMIDGQILAERNVGKLSKQIESSFTSELQQAYRQLGIFDSLEKCRQDSGLIHLSDRIDTSLLTQYLQQHGSNEKDSVYYTFDRVAWINKEGWQILKAQLGDQNLLNQEVKDRNYYKVFQKNQPYALPGHPDDAMGLEAVMSRTTGEFTFVLAKRSIVKGAFITTLVTRLNSVMRTVMPAGYGFCIIDQQGNVQVHSDPNRSLNENFLEQAVPSEPLQESIASRQTMSYSDMKFYGKQYTVKISPISNLPLSLITFYDEGYIVPVNMRILIFSMIFCLISYVAILFLWFIFIWKNYYARPLLYSPMDMLQWVVPKYASVPYYRRFTWFLFSYILLLLLLMVSMAKFTNMNSNYLVLAVILLTPMNVICGLIIQADPPGTTGGLKKIMPPATIAILLLAVVSIIALFYLKTLTSSVGPAFLIFQILFITGMLLYRFFAPPVGSGGSAHDKNELTKYSILSLLLIICLTVFPAGLFTWYSNNQEILQMVKKQQLYTAEKLYQRKMAVLATMTEMNPDWLRPGFLDQLQYQKGVYSIYSDTVCPPEFRVADSAYDVSYASLYFDIANRISNNYYDPQNFPALEDQASDKSWYWKPETADSLSFFYRLPPDPLKKDSATTLKIVSKIPARYTFLGFSSKGFLLLLTVFCLFYGLFALVKYIVGRLFLRKYIVFPTTKQEVWKGIAALVVPYKKTVIDENMELKLTELPREYERYPPGLSEEKCIAGEKDIIKQTHDLKGFFDFVWDNCSVSQQYLLYNFSRDGLMNFRNSTEIHELLNNGILIQEDERIVLMSISFRVYVLEILPAGQLEKLKQNIKAGSVWQSFRTPFLVILIAAAVFIFFTQEETWQRVMAAITGLGGSLPLLLNAINAKGDKKD